MTIFQLFDKIKPIIQKLRLHPDLSYDKVVQDDNFEKIEDEVREAQLLIRKNLKHNGPERPFGMEKEKFEELNKAVKKAFGFILLDRLTVKILKSLFLLFIGSPRRTRSHNRRP